MTGADGSFESASLPLPPSASEPGAQNTPDFRWQALFQRSSDPIFVLNRRRRILFVNQAWEKLTGIGATEARGLACIRRTPIVQDPWDVVIRALCCPPPEVLKGQPGRTRRLVPGTKTAWRWWEFDFLPFRDSDGLLCVLGKIAAPSEREQVETPPLPEKLAALRSGVEQRHSLDRLAGNSPAMRRVLEQVRLASESRFPVLIRGERGAGKSWVARTIHYQRSGNPGPFVALDCTRLPASALAAVLFDHYSLRGQADQGTRYLREPGNLPRDAQARLCDLMGASSAASEPRIMAGCDVDPADEAGTSRLLEELHCALSTLVIEVPPLRERQTDMPTLVDRLLERANTGREQPVIGLTPEAWEFVRAYSWPGNLRELYSALQTACLHAPNDRLDVCHFPAALRLAVRLDETPDASKELALPLDHLLEQAERRLILLALRKAQGNRSRAAEILSIWRPRLLRRMEALKIQETG